ncbi:hypothetical protein OK349_06200 [Sphingomonas sp. BT-65]|uniref:hypothetical protein n=1 Tax=Sphingomonas sp. BT-65 TaxID=2989821 RepID=UPI002235571B|nr:hypothetical protein [Sphingomonas sp. BT-65]MCW4461291.1 hypothetical protein [Sphingomonas sp. BT-65]
MNETPAEKAEARAIRRRWLTIGEIVAVAGVIIAGVSLWISWADKRNEASEKAAEASKAKAAETRLDLRASVSDGGQQVVLSDPAHEILDTAIAFPEALNIGAQAPVLPRIEASWFGSPVLGATDKGADEREGRLPVLVTVSYRAGDVTKQDRAIVELVWRTSGRMLAGRELRIEAARVRERGGDQARIDAMWAQELARLKAPA